MARTKTRQFRVDATRPLYAVVGAGDLVVEYARHTAGDVQSRFGKVELEPKALRDQARKVVVTRVDELQNEAKALPGRAQALVGGYVADLNETVSGTVSGTVAGLGDTYAGLATRGKTLVTRIRRQQATQDAKAAAGTTTAKAKTATTQVKKSASSTRSAAKKTAKTAKTNAKTTTTSARKTASSAAKATAKGAEKVGD
jgi:hypothetical protein